VLCHEKLTTYIYTYPAVDKKLKQGYVQSDRYATARVGKLVPQDAFRNNQVPPGRTRHRSRLSCSLIPAVG